MTVQAPPRSLNSTSVVPTAPVHSAADSHHERRGCGDSQASSTGATTSTPSASPATYCGHTSRNGTPEPSTVVTAPIVPPTSGPTTTARQRNWSSSRSRVSEPWVLPARRIRPAPTSGSTMLPSDQPSADASEAPVARSPAVSATSTAPSTQPHSRVGSSSSAPTVSPAAGHSPAAASPEWSSQSTNRVSER